MAEAQNQEKIGFHKGSVTVLIKEREELMRLVTITEQLLQAHIKALKDMGIDLEQQTQQKAKEKLDEKIV